jgi:RNA polymerase sigma-70 factor (ECF subfamily)
VKVSDSSLAGQGIRFHSTCWDAVLSSAQSQEPNARSAREQLCRAYWRPLYAFIRGRGYSSDDAKDLTQGFFLFLFDRKVLAQATPAKGKFRSFLLVCLKNFLANEFDRENTIKRGRGINFVPLQLEVAEGNYSNEPIDDLTADKIFDARWALTLLDRAVQRLKEEYNSSGRSAAFEVLQPFLGFSEFSEPFGYEVIAEKLNVSIGGAKTVVHRFRRRYAEMLRNAVSQTVADSAEINGEIRALREALVAARGRVEL